MTDDEAVSIATVVAAQISDGNMHNMRRIIADAIRFHANLSINPERAAKAVAEYRQHGCHYAEGTCPECAAIASAAIAAIQLP